jgi:hypothetical protein
MSLNFPVDTSVQLSYSSFPFATPSLDNYTTSNYVSNISNVLINNINTKQPILTAATTLLGVGSSISALDYSKITINKPSFFPTDWNTTISNKPSTFPVDTGIYYNQTQVNNLLNAKQASISTYSITGATGGNFGFTTGTLTIGMPTNYTASMSLSNLITPTSFIYKGTELSTTLATKQNNLTFSSPLVNTTNTITFNESAITTLTNFYNKTEANSLLNAKQATLTFSSPLVNTTNTITFNESSITTLTNFYNKTEANARYLKLAGGDLTGTLNIKTGTSVIHFGTRLIDNLLTLWGDGTSTYGIGINNATLRYNVPTNTTHRFYTGTTNTVTIDGSGNVGIGITNPFASLSIGTPATTSDGTLTISRNNAGFRNFKFGYDANFNFCMGDFGSNVSGNTWRSTDLTIRWETGNVGIGIAPQTQKLYVNGSVYITAATTINAALTATSFSGDGANITNVPYSTITGKPTNFQADWNTTIINKPSTFPVDTTVYYNKTEVNNLLNAKDAILSFTSPLIRTTNTITFSESAITTLTNFYNKTGSDARYLQLTGGIVSGILRVNNEFQVGDATYQLLIQKPSATAAAYIQTIQQGVNYNQNLALQFNGGNVGIGTSTNITEKLVVNGNIKAQIINLTTSASGNNVLYIKSTNTGANNCIQIQNDLNKTVYMGIAGSAYANNYRNNFFIESANGGIVLNTQGRNSTSTPNLLIRTDGNIETSGYIWAGGATTGLRINGNDYGNTIYQDAITIGAAAADIGFTLRNANSFVFKSLTAPSYIEICKMNTSAINLNTAVYIRPIVSDRGSYDHSQAPLTITNQTPTTATVLNDSLPVLNLCRQGTGSVAYGARATLCLSRFENVGVWSRTRLDFKLASDSYNDVFAMTLRSDGNTYFYPNPQYINNTNGANYAINLNVGCFTSGYATAPFITCIVNDGWNSINTSTIITAQSGAYSGYNNSSRIYLDASYNTNASFGTLASYISFQSINSGGGWNTNAYLRTTNTSITFRVDGNISCFSLTQTSTSNIKTEIQPIQNPLNIITQLEGHYYKNIKTDNYDYGLIAEEVENILPDIVDKTNEDLIGISYTSLIPILIEGIKELNKNNQQLQERISILESQQN